MNYFYENELILNNKCNEHNKKIKLDFFVLVMKKYVLLVLDFLMMII
jgi:hypothetical protein